MKIYFDGCAKTFGTKAYPEHESKRFSALLCKELGAEEYNISRSGSSNRRLVRNLFEHQDRLAEFDLFVIQMTKRRRWEFFDKESRIWKNVSECKVNPHLDPIFAMDYLNHPDPQFENWKEQYFTNVYTPEMGIIDEKMCYTCIKSILSDRRHILLWIGHPNDEPLHPIDLKYKKHVDYIGDHDEEFYFRIYKESISTGPSYEFIRNIK